MKIPKIEYWKARKFWYWRIRASNGETLCHSEGYNTKQACLKGISAMKLAVILSLYPTEVKK